MVKISNPPPLTFQLQRGRLADGYSDAMQFKGKGGLRWVILVEKLAKKRKSMAQSKLRTTTYVEDLACNRSDSGCYKFSNVRSAGSQGNV